MPTADSSSEKTLALLAPCQLLYQITNTNNTNNKNDNNTFLFNPELTLHATDNLTGSAL